MAPPARDWGQDRGQIPVVILCGGMGTRIREASERLPKPMIDIGGKPILWHIMQTFGHHGFRRFVLCLGYKAWDIKEYFLRYRENQSDFTIGLKRDGPLTFHDNPDSAEDWEVTCVDTGLATGTGGRIPRVAHHLDHDRFLLTYGDGIGDVDIGALLDFHLGQGRTGTVTGVHPTSRFGELTVDDERVEQVTLFAEKPTAGGWISGGFFVFERSFLDYLWPEDDCFLEQDPLQRLAADGQLSIFCHTGFWMGMDTFREYTHLNALWSEGKAPWKVWDG